MAAPLRSCPRCLAVAAEAEREDGEGQPEDRREIPTGDPPVRTGAFPHRPLVAACHRRRDRERHHHHEEPKPAETSHGETTEQASYLTGNRRKRTAPTEP